MSIIIHGMKMPKDRAVIEIHPVGGYACTRYGFVVGRVIELPPHGRLIDADALLKDHGLETYCPEITRDERPFQYEMFRPTIDFCKWVEDAKTIIPAEEG